MEGEAMLIDDSEARSDQLEVQLSGFREVGEFLKNLGFQGNFLEFL